MPAKKSTNSATKAKVKKTVKKVSQEAQEVYRVEGKKLITKIKELVKEGNVRRLTVKNKKGDTVFVMPVTAGVLGAVLIPPLAVLAAVLVFAGEYEVVVDRKK